MAGGGGGSRQGSGNGGGGGRLGGWKSPVSVRHMWTMCGTIPLTSLRGVWRAWPGGLPRTPYASTRLLHRPVMRPALPCPAAPGPASEPANQARSPHLLLLLLPSPARRRLGRRPPCCRRRRGRPRWQRRRQRTARTPSSPPWRQTRPGRCRLRQAGAGGRAGGVQLRAGRVQTQQSCMGWVGASSKYWEVAAGAWELPGHYLPACPRVPGRRPAPRPSPSCKVNLLALRCAR